ncbi:cytochrome c oxidase assembly protein [Actinospica durhamensis]|uniref:Cytochrome c oxidase assembly protein n=1 Tax=Actinospica durhamensis TaxID=1508375 RepID=A0A941EL94_9ACTN|nr:cytochrome c oxidase assembly protein [Actinospica durhamensis]
MELLSAHMIQHMTLSMLAPIPLLFGARSPSPYARCARRATDARAPANCCWRSCTRAAPPS